MVGRYTENLKKPQTVKIGGWALAWVWALAQDNTVACSLDMAVYRQQLPTHLDKYGSLL